MFIAALVHWFCRHWSEGAAGMRSQEHQTCQFVRDRKTAVHYALYFTTLPLPIIDKTLFEAINESLLQVTLELGGKSALVIFDDSEVKSAVAASMLANFLNQGIHVPDV